MTNPIEQSRKDFETEFRKLFPTASEQLLFEVRQDGKYASLVTHSAYVSWQAARAPLEADMAELNKQLYSFYTNTSGDMTMNNRNFSYFDRGVISDNNFDFDAMLKVSGDFGGSDKLDEYCKMITAALNNAKSVASLTLALEKAEKDAARYRAAREQAWCDYDDYVNSVGKPDSSWTRDAKEEFIKNHDEEADMQCEHFEISADTALSQSKASDEQSKG
jgi:hypothetical protein